MAMLNNQRVVFLRLCHSIFPIFYTVIQHGLLGNSHWMIGKSLLVGGNSPNDVHPRFVSPGASPGLDLFRVPSQFWPEIPVMDVSKITPFVELLGGFNPSEKY